jgi:hypothetical protein
MLYRISRAVYREDMTNTEAQPAKLARRDAGFYTAKNDQDVLSPRFLSCNVYRVGREWEIRFFPERVVPSTGRTTSDESVTQEAWSLRMARRIIARVFAAYDPEGWSYPHSHVRDLARTAYLAETDAELALLHGQGPES